MKVAVVGFLPRQLDRHDPDIFYSRKLAERSCGSDLPCEEELMSSVFADEGQKDSFVKALQNSMNLLRIPIQNSSLWRQALLLSRSSVEPCSSFVRMSSIRIPNFYCPAWTAPRATLREWLELNFYESFCTDENSNEAMEQLRSCWTNCVLKRDLAVFAQDAVRNRNRLARAFLKLVLVSCSTQSCVEASSTLLQNSFEDIDQDLRMSFEQDVPSLI